MTLYKTIWTLLKANKSNLLIGVLITVVVTFFYAQSIDVENTSLQEAKIALISEEESPVVDGLRAYLKEKQTLVTLDGTSQKEIDDALYFNRVNIVMCQQISLIKLRQARCRRSRFKVDQMPFLKQSSLSK